MKERMSKTKRVCESRTANTEVQFNGKYIASDKEITCNEINNILGMPTMKQDMMKQANIEFPTPPFNTNYHC